jgi:hypothetical protein
MKKASILFACVIAASALPALAADTKVPVPSPRPQLAHTAAMSKTNRLLVEKVIADCSASAKSYDDTIGCDEFADLNVSPNSAFKFTTLKQLQRISNR